MVVAPAPPATDVAIIGAGPVGLFSVFQCGMLGFRCQVIDALDALGGQCAALYPDKPIYDIPGYPRIGALELVERLREQAAPFDPVYRLGRPVLRIERAREDDGCDGWRLVLGGGDSLRAGAVIVAGGAGAFGPVRLPHDNAAEFEGRSLFYLVRRKADLAGKRVVIAGGGDSAVDWALALHSVARSVSVVHRRGKFRAAPDSVRRMRVLADSGGLEIVAPYQLAALDGDDGRIRTVTVAGLDGGERTLPADVVLAFFGLVNRLGPIGEWGLDLDSRRRIRVDPATCGTNLPGVFAVGDIAAYPGKLKLILTGFAESAAAAHAIHPILRPDQALHFEYSTVTGVAGLSRT